MKTHPIRGPRLSPYLIERLEDRTLLANLHMVSAYLTDANGNPLASVAVGQAYVYMQVEFQTTALPANAQYILRTTLTGQSYFNTLDWGAGVAGTSNWVFRWGNWVKGSGSESASAKLDDSSQIAETDEADNTDAFFAGGVVPGFKFVQPLEGTPFVNWSIGNYVDVDAGSGLRDYRGGTFTYNGHNGWDIGPANWRAADSGIEIYAAAAGTVSSADDGNYDRNYQALGQPANYVVIDHGGGWSTTYYHMRRDSVAVSVGQHVNAGDFLGLVGSSGNSTGPHLHFGVYYNGQQVEPNVAPSSYFITPIGYSADNPTILDSGITNYDPSSEFADGPAPATEILPGGTAYYWVSPAGVNAGDTFDMVWYRPDNSVFSTYNWTPGQLQGGSWYASIGVPAAGPLGTWHVAFKINGVQKSYDPFYVQSTGAPQVRIYKPVPIGSPTYVVDGRTTPFDFGTVKQYQVAAGPTQSFNVLNSGQATLTTTGLGVPSGFTVTSGLASSITAGSSDSFSVRLDTATTGHKIGTVAFLTNDNDGGETIMTFRIEGQIDPISPLSLGTGIDTAYLRRNGVNTEIFINTPPGPSPTYVVPIAQMANFVLNTDDGNDSVTVDYSNGDPLSTGGLTVNGGTGTDTLTIIGDAGSNTFTYNPGNNVVFGTDIIHFTSVETVALDGAGSNDAFNIGAGDIDSNVLADLDITGGAGNDTINLNDQSDNSGNDTYSLTSSSFAKTSYNHALSYASTESLVLNANPFNNTVNIESNTATTINGGNGNDTIQISPVAGTLFNIGGGDVAVHGDAGTDALKIFDNNYGGPANFAVTPTTVLLPFNGAETPYTGLEAISIVSGGGANIYAVNGTASATPLEVNAGGGTDTLNINETADAAPVTIDPSAGDDTVNVNADATGNAAALFAATQRIGALHMGSGGTATLIPGGNIVLTLTGADLTGSARMDLNNNDLIWDYTGASALPAARALLAGGSNAGSWNGAGIGTGLGNATTYALGYGEASALAPGGTFSGQPVDATAVLIKFTYYGDTNLDGQVDVIDLGNLATNWQLSPRNWADGNFSYDDLVDVIDLGMLATNWQLGVGSPL